ncbi:MULTISPECIES: hypothetical protein [Thioalkalivibrio]|uniref:Lipoprotein n=1 Tax=Thioalkalivibrio versutus TaxID=106634 RepID=A0A0G3G3Z5_9GAMM|nr:MULTISPECIES: hypothetical protein [Thioalkalivibrio]AKJ95955.1 lipoprotein [Thioalkalivibrio versutus]OOC50106.1 hypothetical protein B0684_03815 [Thioalkalivibrio versutus]
MNTRTLLVILFASLIALAGCRGTVPVHNVSDTTVTDVAGERPSAEQMERAIRTAGTALGWRMEEVEPGLLEGRLALRDHVAEVEIPYAAGEYSIRYKDSTNLNYADGNIHPNYNNWIQNLDNQIRAQISAL